jgi:putative membrane protein
LNKKNNAKIDPKDLMAVERTATGLIGTSISLIIFGFVVEKFELFLHIIEAELKNKPHSKLPELSHVNFYNYLGIAIVVSGVLLAIYTYIYYSNWIKCLQKNKIKTDKNIFFLLSLFLAIVGLFIIVGMIII